MKASQAHPKNGAGRRRDAARTRDALIAAGTATGGRIVTVEDHYAAGGIGDAVAEAVSDPAIRVHRVAVRELHRSGKPEELLDRYGISARHIVEAVRAVLLGKAVGAPA